MPHMLDYVKRGWDYFYFTILVQVGLNLGYFFLKGSFFCRSLKVSSILTLKLRRTGFTEFSDNILCKRFFQLVTSCVRDQGVTLQQTRHRQQQKILTLAFHVVHWTSIPFKEIFQCCPYFTCFYALKSKFNKKTHLTFYYICSNDRHVTLFHSYIFSMS